MIQDYNRIAQSIISVHAPQFRNNPDMIDCVISAVLMADWKYDPVDYTGEDKKTLEGYRKQRAVWAIHDFFRQKRRKEKNLIISIDELDPEEDITIPTHETDINFSHFQYLTEREALILDLRFNKSCTFREIGRKLSCKKQNAHRILKKGLEKLKKNHQNLSIL